MQSIAIILFDQVEVLDFAGPFEVFSVTGRRNVGEAYHVFTVAEKRSISTRNNLMIQPTYSFDECPQTDMFLVPGGGGFHENGVPFGTRHEMNNPVMLDWIKERSENASLILSVCTGALLLAKAGLLDRKEATTHFMAVDLLKSISPTIRVSPEKRWVDNGNIILSAGVSAGIDMSLHVIDSQQGPDVARETARYMQYDYWK
jgi:transcriptional regulator GlxA family with amidase domain